MKTVVDFPEQGVVAAEAAEWLIRLDADTPPSKQELRALGEWLHRSPAHREELEKLATLWGRLNALTELAVPLGNPSRVTTSSFFTPGGVSPGAWHRHVAVAAVVIGAFACGLVWLLGSPSSATLTASNGLYATAVGQQTTTQLPDGSQIVLNTNSQIRVDFGDAYRRVHLLQGEALFTVAKDRDRPFRVYAGGGRIEAVGTAFSVYLRGADAEVTVAEGRVALAAIKPADAKVAGLPKASVSRPEGSSDPNDSIDEDEGVMTLGTLGAGQGATIRSPAEEAAAVEASTLTAVKPLPPVELAERLAWREGVLMFSGEPLEDVVREISRYTTVSIEIPDPAVRNMRIGGRFPVGETDVMLAALESNFHLRVSRLSANRVVLTAVEE